MSTYWLRVAARSILHANGRATVSIGIPREAMLSMDAIAPRIGQLRATSTVTPRPTPPATSTSTSRSAHAAVYQPPLASNVARAQVADAEQVARSAAAATAGDIMEHRGGQHKALLTRYPDMTAGGVLRGLDYFGTSIFAVSGSLTALSSGMDIIGGVMVGIITAVGGGTARDVLVGQHPVFWLVETEYLAMAVVAATAAYVSAPYLSDKWPANQNSPVRSAWESFMKWGDAVGVGAFACIGAHCALRRGMPVGVCVLLGLMTSTFGGMARDVLCHRPVRILNHNNDMYATVALSSALAYTTATLIGLSPAVRVASAVGTSLTGRYLANHRAMCTDTDMV